MKKLILLLILMISTHLITSQNIYPKEIVLNGDSLIAFTYNQQRVINADLEAFEGCKIELLETEKLVLKYDSIAKDGLDLITNLKAQIEGYSKLVKYKDKQLDLRDKENEKLKKSNKGLKTGIGISIGIGGAAFVAGFIYGATK